MEFEKNNSAGFLANQMARLFAKGLQDRIAPLGIVPGQFPMLLALWEHDGVTQRELLSKLDIEQATLANTLTRMERDGLIKRTKHPSDARAQQIWLTAKTKKVREEAYVAAEDQNNLALAELSKSQQQEFIGLMRQVIKTMSNGHPE